MYYLHNSGLSDLEDLGQWEMALPIAGSLVSGLTSLFIGNKKEEDAKKQQELARKIAQEQALAQGRQQAAAQSAAIQQAQIETVSSRNRMVSVGLIVFGAFALGLGGIFLVKALTGKKES
jgi:hypothetical protein